jgi:putative FmdB family regulatory protein
VPTYAYVCTACDHRFEIVQAITDASLTSCPECGGTLRKVFHPVGVAFKGSGFYRTDSRTSEAKGKETSEVGAKSESASKDSGASADKSSTGDAKPASKSGASTPSGGASGSSPSSGSSGGSSSGDSS